MRSEPLSSKGLHDRPAIFRIGSGVKPGYSGTGTATRLDEGMELPDSVKAIGEQLDSASDIAPAPELFEAYDVFAAELANIFTQPWLAVDHASRLREDGDFLRADVGSRSVVFVRENADNIHALRNACLHAGYR